VAHQTIEWNMAYLKSRLYFNVTGGSLVGGVGSDEGPDKRYGELIGLSASLPRNCKKTRGPVRALFLAWKR